MHDLALLTAVFTDGRPLGWDAVFDFERRCGIVLPEPYRTCIATITDGHPEGPPERGLLPVGALPRDWGAGRPERVPARPFPLTEAWLWAQDERPVAQIEQLVDPVFDHGSIVLGADGRGAYWTLVVTGRQRGHVWNISEIGACPFGAEFGCTTAPAGFAGWVAHWEQGLDWYDA